MAANESESDSQKCQVSVDASKSRGRISQRQTRSKFDSSCSRSVSPSAANASDCHVQKSRASASAFNLRGRKRQKVMRSRNLDSSSSQSASRTSASASDCRGQKSGASADASDLRGWKRQKVMHSRKFVRSHKRHRHVNQLPGNSESCSSHCKKTHSLNKHQSVTVGAATHKDGRRVRDKKLICFVCKKKVLWLARHLSRCHSKNFLVAQVLAKSGKERQIGWKRLKNLGSFKHNVRVLRKQKGEMIVIRRSAGKHDASAYLPCSKCYGFFYKYEIWRHVCPCEDKLSSDSVNQQPTTSKDVVDSARNMLEGAVYGKEITVDKVVRREILQRMRHDDKLQCIKSDMLILKFGSAQMKRIGIKGRHRIAARMRLLARFVTVLKRKTNIHSESLYHFLSGTYFAPVVESVEEMCGLRYDRHGQRSFDKPSLALAVGSCLLKCCSIKKGIAIRQNDKKAVKDVELFLDLYRSDYSDYLLCLALSSLKMNKYNKVDELPTTADLLKMKKHTEVQIKTLSDALKKNPNYTNWKKLSEMVLTRLIIFNKRRASEPAKMEVSQYVQRLNWRLKSSKDLVKNLKPLECQLMKRMDLVQVPGKRNRKVPILIMPDITEAMELLLAMRKRSGIPAQNRYFFATASKDGYLNTWMVLHNTAMAAGLDKPHLISLSRLRKYIATIAQVHH